MRETISPSGDLLKINPELDVSEIARTFGKFRRVHIPDILPPEAADALHVCMRDEVPWRVIFNTGDNVYDLDEATVETIPEPKRLDLSRGVAAQARDQFQYIYNSYRIDEGAHKNPDADLLVHDYYHFINSKPFLEFIHRITGIPTIVYADAQATRYMPGHFLTMHDDDVSGKHRRLAMVLNLTRNWKADWGGTLQFIGPDGHVVEGYIPTYNALNIFEVPHDHIVSYVTPFAGVPRFSITGWLREQVPEVPGG